MNEQKTNLENVVKTFEITGPCEIDIESLKLLWNTDWSISQWKDEYTLCHFNIESENFTKTDLKVLISEKTAVEIIEIFKLKKQECGFFRYGSTWRN